MGFLPVLILDLHY